MLTRIKTLRYEKQKNEQKIEKDLGKIANVVGEGDPIFDFPRVSFDFCLDHFT